MKRYLLAVDLKVKCADGSIKENVRMFGCDQNKCLVYLDENDNELEVIEKMSANYLGSLIDVVRALKYFGGT